MSLWVTIILLLVTFACYGCATEQHLVPVLARSSYNLSHWPTTGVIVEVEDLWSLKTSDSEQLKQLIQQTLVNTLQTGAQHREDRLLVRVAILQHHARFSPGIWTAQTRLKTTISRAGQQVSEWTAVGEATRVNVLPGLLEPQFASNTAFQQAMDELMAQLATSPKF